MNFTRYLRSLGPWFYAGILVLLLNAALLLGRNFSVATARNDVRRLESDARKIAVPSPTLVEVQNQLKEHRLRVDAFRAGLLTRDQAGTLAASWRGQWALSVESVEANSEYTRSCLRLELNHAPISDWPRIVAWIESLKQQTGLRLVEASLAAEGTPPKREFSRVLLRLHVFSTEAWGNGEKGVL